MAELIEINVKAKKEAAPAPKLAEVPLVVGKYYVTNGGERVLCREAVPHHKYGGTIYKVGGDSPETAWLADSKGKFIGMQSFPDYSDHIAREWLSEVHDAWLDGMPIQIKMKDSDHMYAWQALGTTAAFFMSAAYPGGITGPQAQSWMKSIFGANSIYELRIKP